MVMAKQHEKGSPKRASNEPAPRSAVAGRPRPAPPAPFRLEQCCRCDDHRRQEGDGSLNGAGPLLLTLGPLSPGTDRRCSCVVAPAPAPTPATMSVLRGSRYLRPAQELLGEVVRMADLAAGAGDEEAAADKQERLEAGGHRAVRRAAKNDGDGIQAKLLALLSELESRQESYFGELGRVASSFEPALGDGAASAYTSLMAQAMARHFGNLRRAILRRLRLHAAAAAKRSLRAGEEGEHGDGDEEEEVTEEMVDRVARRTKLAAAARAEQAWRPIRGLPEGSVAVLRAWLFDHFLHPYPDDGEKLRLAVTTGLSRSQISNWFINARVRLWKPMIEEMYKDEFSEGSAVSRDDDTSGASSSS
ncbi:BEL1-like homeodomain protein 11 [Panicum miliaceum]|uniref:BEL1-like homeodomain protein 11 n=1 Tax=Panicum miliaceum TaxID=4540 RepID=A0A3L6S5R2_PANMI|nr:BEL1-like homeodomain protein 11 [Panicum miliaceum]